MFREFTLRQLSTFSLIQKQYTGIGTIFTLHRVAPPDPSRLHETEVMKVSPSHLEDTILALKERGYRFVSMDWLSKAFSEKIYFEKVALFTVDDGYNDLITHAYPIFKKHSVPFTVYITTSFPERGAVLWWYGLEEILLDNDRLVLEDGRVFPAKTNREKNETFRKIRKIIMERCTDSEKIPTFFETLFSRYNIDWSAYSHLYCAHWADLVKISNDPLVTIGNHTKDHYALNRLNIQELVRQIVEAHKILENRMQRKIEYFCYPFGSCNEFGRREISLLKSLGYKSAVTTLYGNLYPEHMYKPLALPRIMLTNKFETWKLGAPRKKRIRRFPY